MSDDQGISVSYNTATGQISPYVPPREEQKTLHSSFQMATTGADNTAPAGHIAAYANLGEKTVIQNTIEWMLENPDKIAALNLPDLNTASPNNHLSGQNSPRIADILSVRDTLGQSTFDVLTGVAMQGAKAFLMDMLVKEAGMTQILNASVNLNIGDQPVTLTAGRHLYTGQNAEGGNNSLQGGNQETESIANRHNVEKGFFIGFPH